MIDGLIAGVCIGTVVALFIGVALHFIWRFLTYDEDTPDL